MCVKFLYLRLAKDGTGVLGRFPVGTKFAVELWVSREKTKSTAGAVLFGILM